MNRRVLVWGITSFIVVLLGVLVAVWLTTPDEMDAETAEPQPTVVLTYTSSELIEYDVTVYSVDVVMPDDADETTLPPEGSKWLFVQAAVQNIRGEATEITAEGLLLNDTEGQQYSAERDDTVETNLVGAKIPTSDGIIGTARFTLPLDADAVMLTWCVDGPDPCEQAFTAELPPAN